MTQIPNISEPQSLYELSWTYAQDGKCAVDGATGIVVDANPAAEALMGYSRAELIGMHITMLHPEAERERVQDELRKATQHAAPHLGLHIQQKDGRCVPVAIWSSELLKLADRSITIVEFRDITVHNDEIKHLEQVEARYRGLLEAAPDGMVVVNQGGEIVLLNVQAEKQFGYRRDELLGQKVTDIIPQGFAERLIADGTRTAAEALAQQIGTGIELNGLRKDGSSFPIEIMLSPLESAEGILVTAAIRDITVKKEREHRLTAQNWALSAYAFAALALGRVHSSESLLLQAICEAITRESIYVLAWVGIAEEGPEKKIRIAASAGKAIRYLDGLNLSWSEDGTWGKAPTGICIRTNTLQITDDTQISQAFALWHERARQFVIRSSVSIPLRVEGGWHGALIVYAATPNAFEAPAVEVLQHLAEQIVHAVHALDQGLALNAGQIVLATTQKQLTEALSAMVAPMVAAMEMRDPYTAGHENRVADIAVAIGKEMGWTEEQLHGLRVAAQVHDIGKISIPAEILTKPTQLTAGEWAMIREHPGTGYTILKDIPFSWPIAEIVRQHHERLDGSGYPLGLKGDAILPEAKVLAVADMVEAMGSHRPYRPAIKMDIVLEQIEKEAGGLLDVEAVRTCAALFREKRLVLPSLDLR
ncbi:MAG TPA: PAS domain S-box protein [Terracidiphilus sp.]|nr:PAS domain S-box protein [Terracidiphilus sp.]